MRIHYMHNVCTITPNPVLLVARNCAHYVQSDARGEILMSHFNLQSLGMLDLYETFHESGVFIFRLT